VYLNVGFRTHYVNFIWPQPMKKGHQLFDKSLIHW